MKTKIIIILIAFSFFSCKAQTPIIDMDNDPNYQTTTENAYYKDVSNFRNQFVGTWLYVNGNDILKVILKKKDMVYISGGIPHYTDFLVGEYQYIRNGVEKVNTLNNLNINYTSVDQHKLFSITKIGLDFYPKCNECPIGTERMLMNFDEPGNDDAVLSAHFVIRRVVEDGVEKLKVQFVKISAAMDINKLDYNTGSTFRNFTLPYGNYTLIKQP